MTPQPRPHAIRVGIVDDHPLVREGTAALLARRSDIDIVGIAVDGRSALQLVEAQQPDVLLLDLGLPDMTGIEVARSLRTSWPDVALLVLTGYATHRYLHLLTRIGVAGLINKSAPVDKLLESIHLAAAGRTLADSSRSSVRRTHQTLTAREHEVLGLMANGFRNAEIAEELSVSLNTVEFHVRHVLDKLDARSRTEAVTRAQAQGYLLPEDASPLDR
ncbi:MAG: response regulator transcription factor [Chloroflexi bacterium]|nr:response regulator transcription factor [Chloroflexota bacterium]